MRLAVGTLTVVRMTPPTRVDRSVARAAMLLAPVAVVPLAVSPFVAHVAVAVLDVPDLLAAALLLVVLAAASRALHLDGLADTVDGFAAGFDPGRSLAVMRSGDIGPAGAAAVVLVLLVDAAALTALLSTWQDTALAAVAVLASRHALAWLCNPRLPPARPGGLGAAVAGTVPTTRAAAAGIALAGLAALGGAAVGLPWYAGPVTTAAAVGAAAAVAARAVRRVGGVTGDVLGAGVEVGLAAALTAATLLP